jgi:hypothetical protein
MAGPRPTVKRRNWSVNSEKKTIAEIEPQLMSLKECAKLGISRVRQPNWSHKMDHIEIHIVRDAAGNPTGQYGPWLKLYSPFNVPINDKDPVSFLAFLPKIDPDASFLAFLPKIDPDAKALFQYFGPLPDSAEYQVESMRCAEGWGHSTPRGGS